MSGKNNKNF